MSETDRNLAVCVLQTYSFHRKIRQGAPRKGDQTGGGCRQNVGRYLSPGLSQE